MTWIRPDEIEIYDAVKSSDYDKLMEYHISPGNGLPNDVIYFAVIVKNVDMIEFLLLDLKYEWYDYYADYLKNFTEEERMKIRDLLRLKREDQWLQEYRLAVSTDNISELEYLCMFNYDVTNEGQILNYAISSGHLEAARFLIKRFMGTNRETINRVIELLQED